jgi:hypothetical protein
MGLEHSFEVSLRVSSGIVTTPEEIKVEVDSSRLATSLSECQRKPVSENTHAIHWKKRQNSNIMH